jgi:hypothetical protein
MNAKSGKMGEQGRFLGWCAQLLCFAHIVSAKAAKFSGIPTSPSRP